MTYLLGGFGPLFYCPKKIFWWFKNSVYLSGIIKQQLEKMPKFSTLLKDTKEQDLVQFNTRSDVYMVIETGEYFTRVRNMYSGKVSNMKNFTTKGGRIHDRKVEIVKYY